MHAYLSTTEYQIHIIHMTKIAQTVNSPNPDRIPVINSSKVNEQTVAHQKKASQNMFRASS